MRAQLRDLGIATPDAVHDAIKDRDVLTAETARSILAHNLTGRRLCGW